MKEIQYTTGDATRPIGEGNKIITHCCNDCIPGRWGAGFVLAISKRWKEPEEQYRKWSVSKSNDNPYKLGQVQFVKVEKDIVVCNMIGQHGTGFYNNIPPIRYDAIESCLQKVSDVAKKYNATVNCPRFGCGLAGGDWEIIEDLIKNNLCAKDISVIVYDFKR